ncbi:MAG: hypothetical protein CVU59_07680 [Deltaproteobacteria bacterium HGW-Deltaproteobacteria-17]|nr:MAG: hypothetical protein CVU59_07680 [Deltaproteobacteria bacterium HGW-Deltaproteobacteria-17]
MQMKFFKTVHEWIETQQSRGRYFFTMQEVITETGKSSVAVQTALRRLRQKGAITCPRRGFYVLVPLEYRSVGSVPATWFIDDLMRHFEQPYYVGLLSAAAIHGAGHQQPLVFQVMTNKPTREVISGRVVIQFLMNKKVEQMPVLALQTETGNMRVATPETTAFDLVRYGSAAAGLGNVGTVLVELAERIDARKLVSLASMVRLPDVQRLGYLLELLGKGKLVIPLAQWMETQRPRAVPLGQGSCKDLRPDPRWHVFPNETVETDL